MPRRIQPPPKPAVDASQAEVDAYNRDYQSYRSQVEAINDQIISVGKSIYDLCEEISFEPNNALSTVSSMIWQGYAAMRFIADGSEAKNGLEKYIESVRQSVSASVARSSSFTTSI